MGAIIEVKYFNTFWSKKQFTGNPREYDIDGDGDLGLDSGLYPGPVSFGDSLTGLQLQEIEGPTGAIGWPYGQNPAEQELLKRNWYVEESRIRGGYGNTTVDFGPRAYINEEEPIQQHRFNSLIYSGVFNSRTGINDTNVFSVGESITRSVNPAYNSIQKIYAEDTNLIIFQENKVNKALIDKDAIYSAEGGGTVTSTNAVIGQIVPYLGEYGISQNPESFAFFGFQKYFADKDRNAILRLSRDGITEINNYGMNDYFRDNLYAINNNFAANIESMLVTAPITALKVFNVTTSSSLQIGDEILYTTDNINYQSFSPPAYVVDIDIVASTYDITSSKRITLSADTSGDTHCAVKRYTRGRILGGYDIYSKSYVLSLQTIPAFFSTASDTFQTVAFDESINGWVSRYTYKPTQLDSLENKYYTIENSSLYEQFDNTIPNKRGFFYENSYAPSTITFVLNTQPSVHKNFQTVNYEGASGWEVNYFESDIEGEDFLEKVLGAEVYNQYQDQTTVVYSYLEGKYETNTPANTGTSAILPPFSHAGFDRKENRYVANLVQKTTDTTTPSTYPPRPGEIIFGNEVSGIKGFYATIKMSTDDVTQVGGAKELFCVATKIVRSS